MAITCGIAWAENQNDVALVDGAGQLVAKRRISDNVEGYRQLLQLLVEAGDTAQDPIPVAVETARGLLISRLRGTTRAVYSINPMAVARYRERHRVAREKSDHAYAMAWPTSCAPTPTCAGRCPRTPSWPRRSRCWPEPSRTRRGNRDQLCNQLRSHLKQYFPSALEAFAVRGIGLDSREARAILAVAPDPTTAVTLTKARLRSVLRGCGRQRNIDTWADR